MGGFEFVVVAEICSSNLPAFDGPFDVVAEGGNLQGLVGIRLEPEQPRERVF